MGCVKTTEKIKLKDINNSNNNKNNINNDSNNNNKTNNNIEENNNSYLKINNNINKAKKFSTFFESKYFIVCELNQSENYNLYKIGLRTEENKYFSMKIIDKTSESNQNEEQKIKNEINILKSLNHPNIIKVYDCLISNTNYKLITEYVSNLNLLDIIKIKKTFKEKTVKSIIFQILSAIKYLNQNNYVHTDIKPSNVIVKPNKNKDFFTNNTIINENEEEVDYLIKLVDFGSTNNTIANCHINNVKNITIPLPYYLSPEIINKKYNSKCDIWSTGIIMYQLLYGFVPFDGKDKEEVINNILNKDINFDINNNNNNKIQNFSDECLNLLKHMLDKIVENRYDSEQCLNDIYFKNYKCNNNKLKIPNVKINNEIKFKIGKNNIDKQNFTTFLYDYDHEINENNHINKSYDFIYPIFSNNDESERNFNKITLKYIQHYLHINYYIDKENVIISNLYNKINNNNNFKNNYTNILNCFLIYSNISNNNKYNFFNLDEFLEKKFKIDFNLFDNKQKEISFENLKEFLIKEKSILINDLLFTAYDDLCYYNTKYFEKIFRNDKNINPKFKIYFKNIIKLMKKNKLKDNYLFNDFRIIVINAIDEIESKILHSNVNNNFNDNEINNKKNNNYYFDNEINNKKNFQINNFIL